MNKCFFVTHSGFDSKSLSCKLEKSIRPFQHASMLMQSACSHYNGRVSSRASPVILKNIVCTIFCFAFTLALLVLSLQLYAVARIELVCDLNWVLNVATQGKQLCVQWYQIKAKPCWALTTELRGIGFKTYTPNLSHIIINS